ncbi:MAG: integrase, partial [Aureliella sp.]
MSVPEPKVEHHEGRGVRSVPIFPELAPILQAAWDAAPVGAEYVVAKQGYRDAAMRPGGWANANLRTQLQKRLTKAGVAPWARLFHSLRASRQTELERQFPRHVVCAWLGNSSQVAERSYSLVTDEDYAQAIAPEKSGA